MVKKSEYEKPCTFGLLLEQRVNMMEKTVRDIKSSFTSFGEKMDVRMTELFNHQSSFVSPDIISKIETKNRIITILTGVVCALLGVAGTFALAAFSYMP